MQARKKILIIGFGDIGERLLTALRSSACPPTVFALVRDAERAKTVRRLGGIPLFGDLCERHSLQRLNGLANWIFHFAPPPSRGLQDTHTRNLIAALGASGQCRAAMLPQRLVYISTTGVYGDCGGAAIDETRAPKPVTDRARRRMDAETNLRTWAKRVGVHLCLLRVPGIYARDRLPVDRLRAGLPALTDTDDVYTNHIHADDLAFACLLAARHGKPNRVYNIVDDQPMKMGDYFDFIADQTGLPRPLRLSRADIKAQVSPMQLTFMQESRQIANNRAKRELRWRLRYPDVEALFLPPLAA